MRINTRLGDFDLREIREADNAAVESVIRACLIEYGADHDGTAWADPFLGRFSEVYSTPGNRYWVVEDKFGEIVGGVGIGALAELDGVCELQKMYCLPHVRGLGVAPALIEAALDYASEYYSAVYLETLPNMFAAQRFYEKHGFQLLDKPLLNTGHYACDVCYIKALK